MKENITGTDKLIVNDYYLNLKGLLYCCQCNGEGNIGSDCCNYHVKKIKNGMYKCDLCEKICELTYCETCKNKYNETNSNFK